MDYLYGISHLIPTRAVDGLHDIPTAHELGAIHMAHGPAVIEHHEAVGKRVPVRNHLLFKPLRPVILLKYIHAERFAIHTDLLVRHLLPISTLLLYRQNLDVFVQFWCFTKIHEIQDIG
jgi:hypothetical protein